MVGYNGAGEAKTPVKPPDAPGMLDYILNMIPTGMNAKKKKALRPCRGF